jgi:superfamily I DNA and/or RNA helicase
MVEKSWEDYFNEAKTYFRNANHLAYVNMSLLKENRLLIKILLDLHKSTVNLIRAYLDYEADTKKITLSKDPHKNLNIFIGKIAPEYLNDEQIDNLIRVLKLARQHKDAPLEFVKKDNEVISAESLKTLICSLSQSISAFPGK